MKQLIQCTELIRRIRSLIWSIWFLSSTYWHSKPCYISLEGSILCKKNYLNFVTQKNHMDQKLTWTILWRLFFETWMLCSLLNVMGNAWGKEISPVKHSFSFSCSVKIIHTAFEKCVGWVIDDRAFWKKERKKNYSCNSF